MGRGKAEKFRTAVFGAEVPCASVPFSVESGRFIHAHAAYRVNGHGAHYTTPSMRMLDNGIRAGTLTKEDLVMVEPLFCITALFFLGWVIYLKLQLADLKARNEKMKKALQEKVSTLKKDVEMGDDAPVWGHKPGAG